MNNDIVLINTQNPRESFMLSSARNNLKKLNLPPQYANQLLGIAAPAAAAGAPAAGRRGRPAGVPNAPRPQQPAAPAAQGNINVGARMQENGLETGYLALPRSIRNAINVINATATPIINNRGASRRQNILGNAGRVTSALEVGPSTIYFIQLGNNTRIASLVKQPGNSHYLITAQSAYQLESPSQLLTALQQRNLAEVHQYLVNEYMERNPEQLTEFKELLRKHINEKKKQEMNKNKLKEAIRQLVDKVLTEEMTNSTSMSTARKIENDIESGKLDPAEVKAAAEKAEKGDSTDLTMLMLTYLQK
jgi:hypothetical protein